ncbi:unnamed protein product [Peniophora sp. CBMAI 1063]|nr:unnamed protein product [Peniophora sp. CBMAI 1063]
MMPIRPCESAFPASVVRDVETPLQVAKNPVGRPRNTAQEVEGFILKHADAHERIRGGLAPLPPIAHLTTTAKLFDHAAIVTIAEYGWDDPLKELKEEPEQEGASEAGDVDEKAGMSVKDVEATVTQTKSLLRKGKGKAGSSGSGDAVAEAERKDAVLAKVRGRVKYLLEYEYRRRAASNRLTYPTKNKKGAKAQAGGGTAAAASHESPKPGGAGFVAKPAGSRTGAGGDILKLFMSKAPRRKQAHLFWADGLKGDESTRFEAEVDARVEEDGRLAAEEGRAATPRQGVRSAVASERYRNFSEDEKAAVREKIDEEHGKLLEEWQGRQSAEPESPDDAAEFLERARELLADLADFVAVRGSAVCVWYTVGPKGAAYCSMAAVESPHKKFKDWKDEDPLVHAQTGLSITVHANNVNKSRWSTLLDDLGPPTPKPAGAELHDGEQPGPSRARGDSEHGSAASAPAPAFDGEAPAFDGEAPWGESAASLPSEPRKDDDGASPAPLPPRARPAPAESSTAALQEGSGFSASGRANDAAQASLDDPEPKRLIERATSEARKRGRAAATPREQSSRPADAGGDAGVQLNAQPTDEEDPSSRLVFAFDDVSARDRRTVDEFKSACESALQSLALRKTWLERTNGLKFFPEVATAFKIGEMRDLAFEVALAYLSLENSSAADEQFLMRADEAGMLEPAYLLTFARSPRNGVARWHSTKAVQGKKRTSALLDWDIHLTLPRQWALLQPDERRDDIGRLVAPANASLTWPANTICPGENGIRILVATLLAWGSGINASESDEGTVWRRMAADVADVLKIVANKHSATHTSTTGGRVK